jgi:hypothetical protein
MEVLYYRPPVSRYQPGCGRYCPPGADVEDCLIGTATALLDRALASAFTTTICFCTDSP